jgi:hypothetical protein
MEQPPKRARRWSSTLGRYRLALLLPSCSLALLSLLLSPAPPPDMPMRPSLKPFSCLPLALHMRALSTKTWLLACAVDGVDSRYTHTHATHTQASVRIVCVRSDVYARTCMCLRSDVYVCVRSDVYVGGRDASTRLTRVSRRPRWLSTLHSLLTRWYGGRSTGAAAMRARWTTTRSSSSSSASSPSLASPSPSPAYLH